jgi:hypothetical protein
LAACETIRPSGEWEELNDLEDDEDVIEMSEVVDEARVPRAMKSPLQPTSREIVEHDLTHLPFSDWCTQCIMGKARNIPHRRQRDKEHLVLHIHVDYGFLGIEEDVEKMIVQVARDEESRALLVRAVPREAWSRTTHS